MQRKLFGIEAEEEEKNLKLSYSYLSGILSYIYQFEEKKPLRWGIKPSKLMSEKDTFTNVSFQQSD